MLECRSPCNACGRRRRSWLRIRERGMQVQEGCWGALLRGLRRPDSMASRAWAWCAARSRTQFHREENVLVGHSREMPPWIGEVGCRDVDGNCALEVRLRRPTHTSCSCERKRVHLLRRSQEWDGRANCTVPEVQSSQGTFLRPIRTKPTISQPPSHLPHLSSHPPSQPQNQRQYPSRQCSRSPQRTTIRSALPASLCSRSFSPSSTLPVRGFPPRTYT
jgi:hypothetical protein